MDANGRPADRVHQPAGRDHHHDDARGAAHYMARLVARWGYLDAHIANLQRGLQSGRVATHEAVRRTISALDELLEGRAEDWPMAGPAQDRGGKGWPTFSARHSARELAAARRRARWCPRYARYRDVPRRPGAARRRGRQEKAGLVAPAGRGRELPAACIRVHTSLDLNARGAPRARPASEVARSSARELAALGQKVLGTARHRRDPAAAARRPRACTSRPPRRSRPRRARRWRAPRPRCPKWFGILPKAPCEVKVMGMHEAPNSTIAYYRQPAPDGSRPGRLHDQHLPARRRARATRPRRWRSTSRSPGTTCRSRSRRS